jgi:hypothetical protein
VSRPPDPVDLGPDPVVLLVRRVASRLTPSGRVTTAALSLIAVQMLFHGWITSGSWFEWDDYIFLADVARGDADTTWLFHSHFGLFMPVSFLLVKIVGGVGLSWAAVATQILVLQLLASLACWWMLRTVFGNRLRILVPLAFYLFSPMVPPPHRDFRSHRVPRQVRAHFAAPTRRSGHGVPAAGRRQLRQVTAHRGRAGRHLGVLVHLGRVG